MYNLISLICVVFVIMVCAAQGGLTSIRNIRDNYIITVSGPTEQSFGLNNPNLRVYNYFDDTQPYDKGAHIGNASVEKLR